jgi:hypothetical protein
MFDDYKSFSICSVCWWGRDKINCGYVEEPQIAWEIPMQLGRHNFFCGNALLIHFGYHTQGEYLKTTNHLEFYKLLSEKL